MTTIGKGLLAEFLGTFYLCFGGIAAILCTTPAVGGGEGVARRGRTPLTFVSARDR